MKVQLSNQLKLSSSAYLRQHADQPVHWQIWSKETLDLAKQLNRPILLSIGYAACHWCHVMAHESFDDELIAQYMNEHFINIKIDREERPDLDQIYMAALTAMGEQGGWPLTMFLTPDAQPFWGGTYFPPYARFNRPGFNDILHSIKQLYHQNKAKVNHNSLVISRHIQQRLAQHIDAQTQEFSSVKLHHSYAQRLNGILDLEFGGIKGAPKFPNAPLMEIFWLQYLNYNDRSAYNAFSLCLHNMLQGGIYDHLGGGLCRYSVDEQWLVPHFEKMLYDNSQLIKHCAFIYAHSQDELLRKRIEETVNWLQRDLQLSNGGFASSLDADSEGIEGKYYIWNRSEIDDILGGDSQLFCETYSITAKGNWENSNILNRLHSSKTKPDERFVQRCKKLLFEARRLRIPPARDDKLVVEWNGQLIVALVNAGRVFDRPDWIELARKTYATIMSSLDKQALAHCLYNYSATVPALSSDYAAMIKASLTLYGYDGDENYLSDARRLNKELNKNHRDQTGDYRLTALNRDDVIIHIHADQDDAIPSATAQLIEALTHLALVDQDDDLHHQVETISQRALYRIQALSYGQAGILNATLISQSAMILHIFADNLNHPMIKIANQMIDMRRIDVIKIIDYDKISSTTIPYIGTENINQPSAYLCIGKQCLPPVHSANALSKLLIENIPLRL